MIAMNRHGSSPNPLLLPDRDEPYRLRDVYQKIVYGCRDELVLDFSDSFLRFSVDADSDSIIGIFHEGTFAAKRGHQSIGSTSPWRQFLNENIGWTWLAINQQGYWDTILISFGSIVPNIMLNAMASSLFVFTIGPMEKITAGKVAKPERSKKIVR